MNLLFSRCQKSETNHFDLASRPKKEVTWNNGRIGNIFQSLGVIRTLPKRATFQNHIFFNHFFLCYSKCLRLKTTFWELTTKESIQTHDIQIESQKFFFLLTANFMSKTVATTTVYMYIYCVYWCICRNLLTPFNKCCNLLGHASRYLFRGRWWVRYGT